MKIFILTSPVIFITIIIFSIILLPAGSTFLSAGPSPSEEENLQSDGSVSELKSTQEATSASGREALQNRRSASAEDSNSLVILWTTDDREVALKMIFMYAYNAKKFNWWDDITLIVWGPSSRLLADDKELQEKIKEIMESGITVKACKGCADQYEGVSEKLSSLGIEVLYVGKEFTDYIKSDAHILTL